MATNKNVNQNRPLFDEPLNQIRRPAQVHVKNHHPPVIRHLPGPRNLDNYCDPNHIEQPYQSSCYLHNGQVNSGYPMESCDLAMQWKQKLHHNVHTSLLTSGSGGQQKIQGTNFNLGPKVAVWDPNNSVHLCPGSSGGSLKNTILGALEQSVFGNNPLTYKDILDYCRHFVQPLGQSSSDLNDPIDQLVKNTLDDLCNEKILVKMVGGKGGGSITYCLAQMYKENGGIPLDASLRPILDVNHSFGGGDGVKQHGHKNRHFPKTKEKNYLKFQGSLTHEKFTEAISPSCNNQTDLIQESLNKENIWMNNAQRLTNVLSGHRQGQGQNPGQGFPITLSCRLNPDSMICESFGARAGLPPHNEGLQRPNSPTDPNDPGQTVPYNYLHDIMVTVYNHNSHKAFHVNNVDNLPRSEVTPSSNRKISTTSTFHSNLKEEKCAGSSLSDERFFTSLLLDQQGPDDPEVNEKVNSGGQSSSVSEFGQSLFCDAPPLIRLGMIKRLQNSQLKNSCVSNPCLPSPSICTSSPSDTNDNKPRKCLSSIGNLSFLEEITEILDKYEKDLTKRNITKVDVFGQTTKGIEKAWWEEQNENEVRSQGNTVTAIRPDRNPFTLWLEGPGLISGDHFWTLTFGNVRGETSTAYVGITSFTLFKEKTKKNLLYGGALSLQGRISEPTPDFGPHILHGDTIGLLASFQGTKLKIWFWHNKRCLGLAYSVPSINFTGGIRPVVRLPNSGAWAAIRKEPYERIPRERERADVEKFGLEGAWDFFSVTVRKESSQKMSISKLETNRREPQLVVKWSGPENKWKFRLHLGTTGKLDFEGIKIGENLWQSKNKKKDKNKDKSKSRGQDLEGQVRFEGPDPDYVQVEDPDGSERSSISSIRSSKGSAANLLKGKKGQNLQDFPMMQFLENPDEVILKGNQFTIRKDVESVNLIRYYRPVIGDPFEQGFPQLR